MASSQDDSEWDKSTSEIQSEDSDELFETRPNRWRGPPQSWRTLTEEDRLTYNAFERLRNQDLSIHLYNAFALRHAPRLLQNHDKSTSGAQVCYVNTPSSLSLMLISCGRTSTPRLGSLFPPARGHRQKAGLRGRCDHTCSHLMTL